MMLGKLDTQNEDGPLPYTKINSKQIKNLNGELKLLEENIGEKRHDIGFGDDFLFMIMKAQSTATKTDELEFMMHQKRIKRHIDRARGQPVRSTEHFQIIYLIRDKGSDIQDM